MQSSRTFYVVLVVLCLTVSGCTCSVHLDCKTFDPSNITLITFDVFAALMDTPTSLHDNIAEILYYLHDDNVTSIMMQWLYAYASLAGKEFDIAVTGPSPFRYTLRESLITILKNNHLDKQVPTDGDVFNSLIAAWGKLVPYEYTIAVLAKVATRYKIAPLSNGDVDTLRHAMSVFISSVPSWYFSSDSPVMAFKPNVKMYEQILSHVPVYNVLHVAGAPADASGAREAGLYSALNMDDPLPLPHEQPCFVLKDIRDLLTVLKMN